MECINKCLFLDFRDGNFWCDLYEEKLDHVRIDADKIEVCRCKICKKEEKEYILSKELENERNRLSQITSASK